MPQNRRKPVPSGLQKSLKGEGCAKCMGTKDVEIHHIHAVMDGGGNEKDNLIPLCFRCHKEWHFVEATSPLQFTEWIGLPPYHVMTRLFQSNSELGSQWIRFLSTLRKAMIEIESEAQP